MFQGASENKRKPSRTISSILFFNKMSRPSVNGTEHFKDIIMKKKGFFGHSGYVSVEQANFKSFHRHRSVPLGIFFLQTTNMLIYRLNMLRCRLSGGPRINTGANKRRVYRAELKINAPGVYSGSQRLFEIPVFIRDGNIKSGLICVVSSS